MSCVLVGFIHGAVGCPFSFDPSLTRPRSGHSRLLNGSKIASRRIGQQATTLVPRIGRAKSATATVMAAKRPAGLSDGAKVSSLPPVVIAFLLGVAVTVVGVLLLKASTTYKTADDIPANVIRGHRSIQGLVVNVADGDTIRIQHQPLIDLGNLFGSSTDQTTSKGRPRLSDSTILIRLAGVDAPETAHRGQEAQPFAIEAKSFVADTLLKKSVQVQVLSKDQYGRVVGMVRYGSWPFSQNLSSELVRRGLATVYRQGGAEYGNLRTEFESLENQAKESQVGMWSLSDVESPAEYKARIRKE